MSTALALLLYWAALAAQAIAESSAAGQPATGQPAAVIDPAKFHALLVGCTKYDNILPERNLRGPANDVELVRRFFTEHLHLPPEGITVLSEAEAAAHGQKFRPTRENIEREIQKLIEASQAGDQVVLLLAGHGGQQPEHKDSDPTYLKPDGLDQMFLPCDCGLWNGKKQCVDNAIADYELRNWCKQITLAKKARLWVILDACCSGWTLKGNSTEVARHVSADDLGVPEAALDKAHKTATERQNASGKSEQPSQANAKEQPFDLSSLSPDYVGIYAAQRDESEIEMLMPCDGDEAQQTKPQGLLTYAIVDILSRASRPITYGELAELVRQRYSQWGRTIGPTPMVEGLAQDREVLGVQRWPGRSSKRWTKDAGLLTANEGTIEGLSPGSILALHPSIDRPDTDTVLAYAKVTDSELLNSTLKLTKYKDVKELRKDVLPDAGSFEVAWTDCGPLRVKVGVDFQPVFTDDAAQVTATQSAADAAASEKMLRSLAAELDKAFSSDAALCEVVNNFHKAQWVVQLRDGKLMLLSKDAAEIRGPLPEDAARFRIAENDPAGSVVRNMTRIARAQNLLSLTAQQAGTSAGRVGGRDAAQPEVGLKILKFQDKNDRQGEPIDLTKGPLTLVAGDLIGWRMTNHGKTDVAVSLLYIDAGFGIQAVFPRPGSGAENMLSKNGGTFTTKPARITADPVGNEHVVLIAVPRQPGQQSPDFSFLQQETLERIRGADGAENAELQTPLGRLLKTAMYGEGGTRGWETNDAIETQLMLQSWRVTAKPGQ